MAGELSGLKAKRGFVRKQITELCNLVTREVQNFTWNDIFIKKSKLDQLDSDVKSLNQDIFDLLIVEKTTETSLETELTECSNYQDKIIEAQVRLNSTTTNPEQVTDNPVLPRLKAPVAPLPIFGGGENETLDRFIHSFGIRLFQL